MDEWRTGVKKDVQESPMTINASGTSQMDCINVQTGPLVEDGREVE